MGLLSVAQQNPILAELLAAGIRYIWAGIAPDDKESILPGAPTRRASGSTGWSNCNIGRAHQPAVAQRAATYISCMEILALLLAVLAVFVVGTLLLLGAHSLSVQIAKLLESLLDKAT